MSASHTLPAELIRPILHHIADPAPLAALCLSSKLLQSEAQRILYHAPTAFPTALRPLQHILLLTTLAHNPLLAALVKTYHVPSLMGRHKPAAYTLLRAVLPLLTNLHELSLIASSAEIAVLPMPRVLCQPTTLTWLQVDADPAGAFPRWLATQHALTALTWICRDGDAVAPLAPGALPALETLEGNMPAMRAVLPGRRVRRLRWRADATWAGCRLEARLKEISGALGRLEALSLECAFTATEYPVVVGHLMSLTALELVGGNCGFTDNLQLPPKLRVLTLSPRAGGKNDGQHIAHRSAFVEALFAKSSTLFQVDMAAKLEGGETFYERWEQGVRKEEYVWSKDVVWV